MPSILRGPSHVRAVGIGRASLSTDRQFVLNTLSVASSRDLRRVDFETATADATLPISVVGKVKTLTFEDAKRSLPVRVRGVVTATSRGRAGFRFRTIRAVYLWTIMPYQMRFPCMRSCGR